MPSWLDEARRLRSSGASYFQIAQTVGASLRSVCHFLSLPDQGQWDDSPQQPRRHSGIKLAPRSSTVAALRPVDQLGRVVLPAETRDRLGIKPGVQLEFFVEDDALIVRKYEPGCTFCGSSKSLSNFRGRPICGSCRDALTAVPASR